MSSGAIIITNEFLAVTQVSLFSLSLDSFIFSFPSLSNGRGVVQSVNVWRLDTSIRREWNISYSLSPGDSLLAMGVEDTICERMETKRHKYPKGGEHKLLYIPR